MNLELLNRLCFSVCIICIVLGMVLSLGMIWLDLHNTEFVWKSWLSIGVFFVSSALTLSVSKTLGGRVQAKSQD